MRDFDSAEARFGSKPGVTAPQQQWPVHLDEQTYKSAQATISSENNALGVSMSDEQYELIALVVERIDTFGMERQLGKSLQPIETK